MKVDCISYKLDVFFKSKYAILQNRMPRFLMKKKQFLKKI